MSLMSGNDTESFLAGFYIDNIGLYVCFAPIKNQSPHHIFYLLVNYYNTVTVMKQVKQRFYKYLPQ